MSGRRTGAASAAVVVSLGIVAVAAERLVVPGVIEDVVGHAAEAEALEAQRVRVLRETERSGVLAARVAAGEATLAGAVDELEPTLRQRPGFELVWGDPPPPSFRHCVALYVITRVAADLAGDPARRAAVLARLDAEYAAMR